MILWEILFIFGKLGTYLLTSQKLDEKIDTTLMSVCRYEAAPCSPKLSLAQRQGENREPGPSKYNTIDLPAPLKLTNSHVIFCLFHQYINRNVKTSTCGYVLDYVFRKSQHPAKK